MRKIFITTLLFITMTATAQQRITHIHVHSRNGAAPMEYSATDRHTASYNGTSIGLGVIGEWRNLGASGAGISMKIGIVDVAVTTSVLRKDDGRYSIVDPFNTDSTTSGCADIRAGIITQDRHAFGIIAGIAYDSGEKELNYGVYYRMYLLKTAALRPSISVAYTRRYGLALGAGLALVLR